MGPKTKQASAERCWPEPVEIAPPMMPGRSARLNVPRLWRGQVVRQASMLERHLKKRALGALVWLVFQNAGRFVRKPRVWCLRFLMRRLCPWLRTKKESMQGYRQNQKQIGGELFFDAKSPRRQGAKKGRWGGALMCLWGERRDWGDQA